ncbi:VOC family protein [Chryseobacterium sp. T16E-39]|uniref:VOC family protein n=1 Tax=Chryseobacterium sp. T16E-39 TaxID=2015076 RepID=UPI001E509B11|nr:VOC family protein [Chryseobacterium sp. T16E-39]
MNRIRLSSSLLIFFFLLSSCQPSEKQNKPQTMSTINPAIYFEIPVHNVERAEKFYSSVFNFKFEKEIIDDYEMSLFPFEEKSNGITGALAKGDVYKPSKEGVIIYFKTSDIDHTLQKVLQNGGQILYPKTLNEKHGFAIAEFEDSEGNRIALHQTLKMRE